MIRAEHIFKSFDGRTVLDDISVEFETGKTNLIIGQSGSGKTVLLKCLVGLHAVDSGEIFYDDIRYTALGFKERKAIRKDIGMIFQGGALLDSSTVAENIRLPLEQYQDLEIHNMYKERTERGDSPESVMQSIWARGRDNARTPMQWTAGENAGFTTGTPWLPVNENHTVINAAAALADPDSIFYYYKKLIALRKELPVFRDGRFTLLCPEDEQLFAYTRDTETEHLLVVCNFSGREASFDFPAEYRGAECLVSNYKEPSVQTIRPYEAWMLIKKEC